ncbi:MAG: exosortase/archaeosortase family protein [Candidatus Omnitrophota bacterium]|nr:exosortase/archaeosortase family protein [Candidatus Omnitrophota bacterium]
MKKYIYYLGWLLVGALFFPLLRTLYAQRWDALGYTHAFFILPISIGLAYWKRKELATAYLETREKFGLINLIIFVLGLLMYLFGWRQDYTVISAFALIPFLYGFIGYIYGSKVQKKLLFPILYLLLMVPPPFALLDRATLPLRYISAYGVEGVFKVLGFAVQREGLMYTVEGYQMVIDDACSGFRSLITMFSLGLVYVYITKSRALKKAVLIASILPLAIIGNMVRIMTISLLSIYFGEEVAQGFLHSFSGIVIFLFIVLGFVAVEALWIKEKKVKKNEPKEFEWFA